MWFCFTSSHTYYLFSSLVYLSLLFKPVFTRAHVHQSAWLPKCTLFSINHYFSWTNQSMNSKQRKKMYFFSSLVQNNNLHIAEIMLYRRLSIKIYNHHLLHWILSRNLHLHDLFFYFQILIWHGCFSVKAPLRQLKSLPSYSKTSVQLLFYTPCW